MKSRMRSRSVSTWGLGLKSMLLSPLLGSGGGKLPGPGVAGEELALLLQQPGQLQRHHVVELALEDARRRAAAAQLRRDRQEELVDQPGRLQRAVQGRPPLAEQRPHSLAAKGSQQRRQVRPPLGPAFDDDESFADLVVSLDSFGAMADHHRVEALAQPDQ